MDLPRIASHTSLSIPQLESLIHFNPNNNANKNNNGNTTDENLNAFARMRMPASKRLQNVAEFSTNIPQIQVLPPGPAHLQPSRKREEANALQNLKRRVEQLRAHQQLDELPPPVAGATVGATAERQDDQRPQLLQRILEQRPVSMVLDLEELQTAWQDSDFITDCLCWHNVYRQRHMAQPLTMCPELCDYAQTWANHLAHTNTFYYRNDRDVGQNLFCRPVNALQNDVTGQEVASYWYSAVRQYDFGKEPDVLHANVNAGHFTQLVWASSRFFGVGKARSRNGKVIVVANYSPPGNISGGFHDNVLIPQPDGGNMVLHVPQVYDMAMSPCDSDTESRSSASNSTR